MKNRIAGDTFVGHKPDLYCLFFAGGEFLSHFFQQGRIERNTNRLNLYR